MVDTRLASTLAEILEIREDQVTPSLALGTIESWDSLRHIELVLRIEQVFDVQFLAEEIASITSVEKIQQALEERGTAG